ncbi:MAG: peptidoglycan bridge formation glycyltransferase FemA/FemB family protein [Patescibacteria group bacterium]|nr:peptidoglycan bridge formation glycyltransferase FemA/FemB family protein [Patescibacteria group bacterium]
MQLIVINHKKKLDDFVGNKPNSQFLQSWEWGEFQNKIYGKIIKLGIEKNGKLAASAILIKKALPAGKSYFYCPRGPILISNFRFPPDRQAGQILDCLLDGIAKIAKEEQAIFLRFEPENELRVKNFELNITKTIDVQPSKTMILDLGQSEDQLLKNMRQKTRYNIRLAERKGVKIIFADARRNEFNALNFEKFWELMVQTSRRDGFRLHDKKYYRQFLEVDFIKLFLAEHDRKIVAAGIFSFFGDTAAYMHGASSNKYRNVMAPYLLQWEAIKKAKELNFKYYDFYGIDSAKWPGVTRFKKGFGGKEIERSGTFDLIFSQRLYGFYKLLRKLRRFF